MIMLYIQYILIINKVVITFYRQEMEILQQKSIILQSRTIKPYFQYQQSTLQISSTAPLAEVVCFSVDPVMKFWLSGAATYFKLTQISKPFNCFGLAKIMKGNEQFQEGSYYFGNTGTNKYLVLDQKASKQVFPVPNDLVAKYGQANFLYLINNGLAAYAGLEILSPLPSQTVLVSTAAGATGLLLCQLLKKRGIRVIGLSSGHKLPFLKQYVDKGIDYKNQMSLEKNLKDQKFSCYFDNVGDRMLDLVLENIEINGRVALCGGISNYDNYSERGIKNTRLLIQKRIRMQGLTFFGMFSKMYKSNLKSMQFSKNIQESHFMSSLRNLWKYYQVAIRSSGKLSSNSDLHILQMGLTLKGEHTEYLLSKVFCAFPSVIASNLPRPYFSKKFQKSYQQPFKEIEIPAAGRNSWKTPLNHPSSEPSVISSL